MTPLFAFLAPIAAKQPEASLSLPTFQRHWWHRNNRLDARPVIWSLENRPQEWDLRFPGSALVLITHKPSQHTFDIGWGFAHLYEARCSCNLRGDAENRFQLFQGLALKRAGRRWIRNSLRRSHDAEQFQNHFVH